MILRCTTTAKLTSQFPQYEDDGVFYEKRPGVWVEPINLRLFLALDGQALTETWLYQYEPPPMTERDAMMRS
jgi:glucans biosynthesis protein